ncbi:MAG: ribose 5-phosphate isomerase B [Bdellovibrionales bacterium]|nr:ribose 5-phosphate isomerase B [Bdellovibrionales bacterium]
MPQLLIASDHAGFALKQTLQKLTPDLKWRDLGPTDEGRVDYPDFAERVAREVAGSNGSALGVLVCGSGIGMSIAANKVAGIRAAVVENPVAARLAREHNDANVLCLGSRFLAPEYAAEILRAWIGARFEGGRHADRVRKIAQIKG